MIKKVTSLLLAGAFVAGAFATAASAASQPLVSVKLVNYIGNAASVPFSPTGDYYVRGDSSVKIFSGRSYSVRLENGMVSLYEGNQLVKSYFNLAIFSPVHYGPSAFLSVGGRNYIGEVQFVAENGNIRPINILPMEDYLKGVVPNEMPSSWNIEALKAQAIAARTYASSYAGSIINDTISYQSYGGYSAWNSRTTKAVDDTGEQVLKYGGKLISAVYSSSNGGSIESAANLWGSSTAPYLSAKPDGFDPKNPWQVQMRKTQINMAGKTAANQSWWDSSQEADPTIASNLKSWLSSRGYAGMQLKIGAITSFSIDSALNSSGRALTGSMGIEFYAKGNPNKLSVLYSHVSVDQLRAMIGGALFKSLLVTGVQDAPDSYTLSGLGYGHGVGMSQWGASIAADRGYTYQQILAFYYPGAELTAANPKNVSVVKPVSVRPADSSGNIISPPLKRYGTVTVSGLNIRSGPGTSYAIVGSMSYGNRFEFLGQNGLWIKLNYNGLTGYSHSDYVKLDAALSAQSAKSPEIKALNAEKKMKVTASALNVRSGPGTEYGSASLLKFGDAVKVLSISGQWAKIAQNGKIAFASALYLK